MRINTRFQIGPPIPYMAGICTPPLHLVRARAFSSGIVLKSESLGNGMYLKESESFFTGDVALTSLL